MYMKNIDWSIVHYDNMTDYWSMYRYLIKSKYVTGQMSEHEAYIITKNIVYSYENIHL